MSSDKVINVGVENMFRLFVWKNFEKKVQPFV